VKFRQAGDIAALGMDYQLRDKLAFVNAGARGIGEANRELKDNTQVAEKRYKELGGDIMVLVTEV
jgi:hypothetical protein